MTLRLMLRVAIVLAVIGLAGACGEAKVSPPRQQPQQTVLTHDQYQQALYRIVSGDDSRAANRLFTDMVATEHPTDVCSAKMTRFHQNLRAIMRQVEDLEAPSDADDAQDEFLAAAQESVRLVGEAADDVGKGELACGQPLNQRIYAMPSTKRAEVALAKLQKQGYFIFGD